MKIPLKYNLRSLWVRKIGTLMTAFGIGLTVAVLVTMMALVRGLEGTFLETGQEHDVIVLRKGSGVETNSYFNRDYFPTIRRLPGVAKGENGEPLAVGEIVVVINYPRHSGEDSNVMVRGTTPLGLAMRPEIEMVEGRFFRKGLREIIVSRSLGNRFQDMELGDQLATAGREWKVVGVFKAGGSAYNSEIWGDYDEIAQAWTRPIYTSILVRTTGTETAREFQNRVGEDRRIQLMAMPQRDYYAQQATSSMGIKALGWFLAVVMGIGSCFAAMNMMYGTIMARFKEVGTLRSIGFRRSSILASFLIEAILLAVLGGVIGCVLALPVHGISTGTTNFTLFTEVLFNFRITPDILLKAVLYSAVVGVLGGFFPALRAARLKLVEVLRD